MKDYIIDACHGHVDPEDPQYKRRAFEHFRDRYTVLLEFFRQEGLLRDPGFGAHVSDWMEFQLRVSDLTDEGHQLVRLCHGTWNPSFGQGHTKRHLVQWKRKLAGLRSAE